MVSLFSRPTMASTIKVPNSPSTGAAGVTVSVSGTVNGASVLSFSTSGTAFLQNTCGDFCDTATPEYGVNPAGVIVVKGEGGGPSPAVGNANLGGGGFYYGALLVSLNGGPDVQLFSTDAADGLGSATPPNSLSFNGSLGSLFGSIGTLKDPTLTFSIEDTDYVNNAGAFSLNDFNVGSLPSPPPMATTPEPMSISLVVSGLLGLGVARRKLS